MRDRKNVAFREYATAKRFHLSLSETEMQYLLAAKSGRGVEAFWPGTRSRGSLIEKGLLERLDDQKRWRGYVLTKAGDLCVQLLHEAGVTAELAPRAERAA